MIVRWIGKKGSEIGIPTAGISAAQDREEGRGREKGRRMWVCVGACAVRCFVSPMVGLGATVHWRAPGRFTYGEKTDNATDTG